jgi:hypothetical protein
MLIDDFQVDETGERSERSARVRWRDGEFRLRIVVPAEFAAPVDDAAPFLASTLLQAMRRGEDLEIKAQVSRALLEKCDHIRRIYCAWDPSLRPCDVRVAGSVTAGERPPGRACFFSRGVDSMFSPGTTPGDGPLTHLVYCEGHDPIMDAQVREQDHQLAREAANRIGLPLLTAFTNIRTMADPVVDWADLFGAGLSSVAHCLGGGVGSVVISSSADYVSQGPCGSNPLLDPLFSTERVRVVHGTIEYSRVQKVAALAAQRPDLLPYLKVCGRVNRVDNCGRCMKCLWTMVCLEAAGALPAAKSFPDRIPLELVRQLRLPYYPLQIGWMQALQALPAADRMRDLRGAIEECLYRSARPALRERGRAAIDWLRGRLRRAEAGGSKPEIRFYREQTDLAVSLLRRGKPYELGRGAATRAA